jgi:serine/threonine protein kinase
MIQKHIKSGSYGCVYRPNFQCATDATDIYPRYEYISKAFSDEEACDNEIAIQESFVNVVDPQHHFTIPMIATGTVSDSADVNIIADKLPWKPSYKHIVFEYGGLDLRDMAKYHPIHTAQVIMWMEPLFKGIRVMNHRGIVHQDIKMQNILIASEKKRASLIDFGLCKKKRDIFGTDNLRRLRHEYPTYPGEYLLAAMLIHGQSNTIGNRYRHFASRVLRNFEVSTISQSPWNALKTLHGDEDTYRQHLIQMYKQVEADIDALKSSKRCTTKAALASYFSKHFGSKIDLYSLGITLLKWQDVLVHYHGGACQLSGEAATLFDELIRKMTHPNAFLRGTISEVCAAYDALYQKLKESEKASLKPRALQKKRQT